MSCTCQLRPSIQRVDGSISKIYPNYNQIGRAGWQILVECPDCGQLWKVDEWDKLQVQLAMKLDGPKDMNTSDKERRKAYLLESRGGLGSEQCSRMGCEAAQVRDSAYCLDHLYALGWRA
jgi:hypothetical protein